MSKQNFPDLSILLGATQMIIAGTAIGVAIGFLLSSSASIVISLGSVPQWFSAGGSLIVAMCAMKALKSYGRQKRSEVYEDIIELDIEALANKFVRSFHSLYIPLRKFIVDKEVADDFMEGPFGLYEEARHDWNRLVILANKLGGHLDHEEWKKFGNSVEYFLGLFFIVVSLRSHRLEAGGLDVLGQLKIGQISEGYFDKNENGEESILKWKDEVNAQMERLVSSGERLHRYVIGEHRKTIC